MAGSIYDWSTTAGTNASADGDINWTEGQLPSTVNDSARTMMKRVAEWVKDHGALTLSGTDTLTVTANSAFTAYATGRTIIAKVANDNTSTTVTLNVNGIGAKRVKIIGRGGELDPQAGDLQAGMYAHFVYDAAGNSAAGSWVLLNPANKQLGVDVQAYDADLSAIAALTSAANKVPYATGAQTWALADFTTTGRAIVAATVTADQILYGNGSNTVTTATLTSVARDLLDDTTVAAQRTTLGLRANSEKYCFRAHKNGTNQTGITTGTPTLVTFGTEDFDIGSYYNTTNSRWTPPAGKYIINAYITQATANMVDTARIGLYIYKNGSAIQFAPEAVSGSGIVQGHGITGIVDADGDDYFEIYATFSGGGDKTIDGTAIQTFFSGWEV